MARKPKEQLDSEVSKIKDEVVDVYPIVQSGSIESVDRQVPLINMTPHTEIVYHTTSVISAADLKAAQPKRYVVKRGGRVLCGQSITVMRVDKVVADNEYDIENLLQQGIDLELVE